MTNAEVADHLSMLAKLMDLHGENAFKSKTYSNAAFQIEKLATNLTDMDPKAIAGVWGIGESVAQKIRELLDSGRMQLLEEYVANTPEGVLQMLQIKGIGPKKIHIIWKEMEIETLGELLYACNENRLTLYKGFGEKTQENIRQSINFFLSQQGLFLYQQAEPIAAEVTSWLVAQFGEENLSITGDFLRQADVIEQLEFLIVATEDQLDAALEGTTALTLESATETTFSCSMLNGPGIVLHYCDASNFVQQLFLSSGSVAFNDAFLAKYGSGILTQPQAADDRAVFAQAGIAFVPPYLRHATHALELAANHQLPQVITVPQIKGIIHSHSKWSDGAETIATMAKAAQAQGFEYLVISDHSRSAGYANGLSIERIAAQHIEIDALNAALSPFKIFKSIESDILIDGSLDYPADVLASFDVVIASIHSVLKMPEEKAMARLLKAIENPYTSILGHMTGRLLLSRAGYPIIHQKIIDACVANQVAIELNAHPRRLDMDWQWIPYALERGALISINPDAHAVEGFADIRYGVLAAQKGMLTATHNLSSYTRDEFEGFVATQRQKRPAAGF